MSALRVLYVDDEPDIREVALLSLRLDPEIEVHAVESGFAALSMLEKDKFLPDLVLLDVMMPGMDGPNTLALLREHASMRRTPVVFMTARAQGFECERLLELGAAAVISKPFDPMTLAKQLRAILGASVDA
jgi:CheY-like chemotaxis protein